MSVPARRATRARSIRAALAAMAACALPVHATVLYKSIGPNGVIQFSDTPPDNGVVIEERIVSPPSDGQAIAGTLDASPLLAFVNPLEIAAADDLAPDEALARANAQVDLAEHALALARASTWTRREGLRLQSWNRARDDEARIAFYERNLQTARANLVALMNRSPIQKTGVRPQFPFPETPGVQVAHR